MARPKHPLGSKSHSFAVDDAVEYGLEAAILLYNFRFWLDYNKVSKRNIRDGYVWTYNTGEDLSKLMPYLSRQQVARVLRALESKGVIIARQFDKRKGMNAKWYTMKHYKVANG